jgi:uncharacterized membrane protein
MSMRLHQLHPAAVHAPLMLLPAAAIVDFATAVTGGGDDARAALGRGLWALGVGAGLLAGVAGLAASQEVKADGPADDDMMWLHGAANLGVLTISAGMAWWRRSRPPTVAQGAFGLGLSALTVYTAYLGGEMVYERGIGVRSATSGADHGGVRRSPPLLSRSAPAAFVRDAVAGLSWLAQRALKVATRREPLRAGALGLTRSRPARAKTRRRAA